MEKIKIKLTSDEMRTLEMMTGFSRQQSFKKMLRERKYWGLTLNCLIIEINALLRKKLIDEKKKYSIRIGIAQAAALELFLSMINLKEQEPYVNILVLSLLGTLDKQLENLSIRLNNNNF